MKTTTIHLPTRRFKWTENEHENSWVPCVKCGSSNLRIKRMHHFEDSISPLWDFVMICLDCQHYPMHLGIKQYEPREVGDTLYQGYVKVVTD